MVDDTAASTVSINEKVKSSIFEIYAILTTTKVIAKANYVAGRNLNHLTILGGCITYRASRHIFYKSMEVSPCPIESMCTGKKVVRDIFIGYPKTGHIAITDAVAASESFVSRNGTYINNLWRKLPGTEFIYRKFKIVTTILLMARQAVMEKLLPVPIKYTIQDCFL